MKTIWKIPLRIDDTQHIQMPIGAKILCVQMQANTPCLWAVVNETGMKESRTFCMYGTGSPVGETQNYVGTIQTYSGLVFHIFETTI